MGEAYMLLRGDFFNRIELDRRGATKALWPLHPDRVTVRLLDSGRRGFIYRPEHGAPIAYTQDEIFHVMGLTLDGIRGCSVIEYARETIGSAQAQEGFAARFWRQGAEGHLAFVAPNALSPAAREANEKVLQARVGGWQQAHKPILLEGGMKAERISVSGRDAQYIESRKFSVADIARFFRVPPHMIGDVDGNTSWGSGIEQMTIGFVNFTLLPLLVAIEQAADRDLILDDNCFAEFNVDGLLRGEAAARATAHRQYVDGGIKSVNEVRVIENLNPLPGEEFERPQRAANIGSVPAGGDPATTRTPPRGAPRQLPPPAPAEDDDTDARGARIAHEAAARLVRKETAAIRRWAPRFEGNRGGWVSWVTDFYGTYVADLERDLLLPAVTARAYCAGHCEALLAGTPDVLAYEWDQYQAAELAAIALEEATP
jgi:HK97 family phage portal protein